MVLNRPSRLVLACLLLASPAPFVSAQPHVSSNPAQPGARAKQKVGFIDFTLKRINAADRDYGQCIAEGRKILLQNTIENGFFWSNMVSLGLLGSFFLVIMYQRRLALQRELRSAESLCQVHNALVRAESKVEEAARRNSELMEALHVASQPASRAPQARAEVEPRVVKISGPAAPSNNAETRESSPESNPGASTVPVESPPLKEVTVTAQTAPQLRLFSADVDQIATINALQQQLTRCQEKVKNLTRQLNDAQRRVQDEQQKNRALKGQ